MRQNDDCKDVNGDAALIAAAQKVEHYEMATYGTLHAFAQTLGRNQDAQLLQKGNWSGKSLGGLE